MSDLKISQLSDGGASQAADEYVVARSGANFRIDGASVAAAATSVGTLSSLTVSGDLTVDTSTLKVDSTNNRVGILTASPAYALDLASGIARFDSSAGDGLRVYGGSGTNQWDIYCNSTNLRFSDNTGGGSAVFDTGMTVAGDLTVDTSTLKVDSANNRVGIGTASPEAQFVVEKQTAGGEGGYIYIDNPAASTSGNKAGIKFGTSSGASFASVPTGEITNVVTEAGNGASALTFGTYNGSSSGERMRLDAVGNLGLGVTPSAWGRGKGFEVGSIGNSVWGDAGPNGIVSLTANAYLSTTNVTTGWKYAYTGPAGRYNISENVHSWYTAPSGTAGTAITFTQAMTLDASGNLGVGTTATAGVRLHQLTTAAIAEHRIECSDTSGVFSRWKSSAGDIGYFGQANVFIGGASSSNLGIASATGAITFGTGATITERARITSGGYFKASDSGAYLSSAGSSHEFRNTVGDNQTIRVSHTAASPYGVSIEFTGAAPDNNTNTFLRCEDTGAVRCYIWSDGDLANHDGVYGTISDERLKQDIVDAGSQWDDLKAIRFRKYRMKTDVAANPDAPAMLGVVAQELEQVSPGLVDEHPDMAQVEVPVLDEDGNETGEFTTEQRPTGTSTKTVKSSILLMKAAVALQEAMARIEALEARLEALEA